MVRPCAFCSTLPACHPKIEVTTRWEAADEQHPWPKPVAQSPEAGRNTPHIHWSVPQHPCCLGSGAAKAVGMLHTGLEPRNLGRSWFRRGGTRLFLVPHVPGDSSGLRSDVQEEWPFWEKENQRRRWSSALSNWVPLSLGWTENCCPRIRSWTGEVSNSWPRKASDASGKQVKSFSLFEPI